MRLRQINTKKSAGLLLFLSIITILFIFLTFQFFLFTDYESRAGLLYKIAGKTFFSAVYVFFPDGKLKNVSPSNNGIYYQPHINAKGDKVVFFGNDSGAPRLWIAYLKTGKVAALSHETNSVRHPVFSWDGSMIAFASDQAHQQAPERIELMRGNGLPRKDMKLNLFIMNDDGQNTRQITYGPHQDQRPAFSPDGKTVAFVSDRGGSMRLWTVKTDGRQGPRPLQKHGWGYRPWYSADGQWIYFFTQVNERHQICKISINGESIEPLSNDDLGKSHGPFTDYDNDVILYHSTRSGKYGIWELPLDGNSPRKLILPKFEEGTAHATRSKNGIIAFDVCKRSFLRKIGSFFEGF
ncbi:MAG: hypothetical protein GY874_02570 [Desulfobacteraceae bacterium]|nr:hypothetical protein [Desulfobacteraceae bacterium]